MIDITNDPTQQVPHEGPEPTNGAGKPDLSRKGFIITYPMFRYWNKESVPEGLKPKPLNLYVHTPYCIQRCAYCYFKTTTLKDNRLLPRGQVLGIVHKGTDARDGLRAWLGRTAAAIRLEPDTRPADA